MTYIAVILTLLLLLTAAETTAVVLMAKRIYGKALAKKADDAVEAEMLREEHRRDRAFDEGIANIMQFAVNGKTGFETE